MCFVSKANARILYSLDILQGSKEFVAIDQLFSL